MLDVLLLYTKDGGLSTPRLRTSERESPFTCNFLIQQEKSVISRIASLASISLLYGSISYR